MTDEGHPTTQSEKPLRIIHVMRAPIGGLFRHVVDLARAQAAMGHHVGIIADSTTGDSRAARILEELSPSLALGVTRVKMHRSPHWSDLWVAYKIAGLLNTFDPDVAHGHGAKGGLFARLPPLVPFFPKPARRILRAYTPHGGSLHFEPTTLVNHLVLMVEKTLERVTDFIPFESEFARGRFVDNIGLTHAKAIVVHNGLNPYEFEPAAHDPDAADFLYVGEWRSLKGVDTLIAALATISAKTGTKPRLRLVGSGPDEAALRCLAQSLDVAGQLNFHAPMAGRDAFRLGRVIVAPSRAESLPYLVLEAIAARVPIVATRVGGVPEIFGPWATRLVESDQPQALADAMHAVLRMDDGERRALADAMAEYVRTNFSLAAMADKITQGYREALRGLPAQETKVVNAAPSRP